MLKLVYFFKMATNLTNVIKIENVGITAFADLIAPGQADSLVVYTFTSTTRLEYKWFY